MMPRYVPDEYDLYEVKSCPICGREFFPLIGEEHCSEKCREMEKTYQADQEWFMENEMYENGAYDEDWL